MFDIVIRGGTIVDGTGAEPYSGDVAIKDGVIVVLGSLKGQEKKRLMLLGKLLPLAL